MSATGTGVDNLTENPAIDLMPAWSPDGTKIIFATDGGLRLMNPDGSGRSTLTTSFEFDPVWSPDGTQIAFTSLRDGNEEIYVMNADGSGQVNRTNTPGSDAQPAWSPDGQKIAFTTTRTGNREVFVMDADGSNPVNVTNHPADDYRPDWQPTPATPVVFVHGFLASRMVCQTGSGIAELWPAHRADRPAAARRHGARRRRRHGSPATGRARGRSSPTGR